MYVLDAILANKSLIEEFVDRYRIKTSTLWHLNNIGIFVYSGSDK